MFHTKRIERTIVTIFTILLYITISMLYMHQDLEQKRLCSVFTYIETKFYLWWSLMLSYIMIM